MDTAKKTEASSPELSAAQIMEVPCILCEAKPSERCKDKTGVTLIGFHALRLELRKQQPNVELPTELTPDEKALVIYYAYVMLCDSVEVHAETIMGKPFDTVAIQRFFAAKAVEMLKKDGLIK